MRRIRLLVTMVGLEERRKGDGKWWPVRGLVVGRGFRVRGSGFGRCARGAGKGGLDAACGSAGAEPRGSRPWVGRRGRSRSMLEARLGGDPMIELTAAARGGGGGGAE